MLRDLCASLHLTHTAIPQADPIPNLQTEKLRQKEVKNLVIQWQIKGLNSNRSGVSLKQQLLLLP